MFQGTFSFLTSIYVCGVSLRLRVSFNFCRYWSQLSDHIYFVYNLGGPTKPADCRIAKLHRGNIWIIHISPSTFPFPWKFLPFFWMFSNSSATTTLGHRQRDSNHPPATGPPPPWPPRDQLSKLATSTGTQAIADTMAVKIGIPHEASPTRPTTKIGIPHHDQAFVSNADHHYGRICRLRHRQFLQCSATSRSISGQLVAGHH